MSSRLNMVEKKIYHKIVKWKVLKSYRTNATKELFIFKAKSAYKEKSVYVKEVLPFSSKEHT